MKPSIASHALAGAVLAAATAAAASVLQPPVLPLAVRNPYLSLWYNAREAPNANWPMFWNGQTIGMGILAHMAPNNTVLSLLGRPQDALLPASDGDNYTYVDPVFNGFQYDAQSTNLSYTLLDDVDVTLVFTSPITADSMLRQSLPVSYLEVIVEGNTDVDIYVDINGMWLTADAGNVMQWSFNQTDALQTWVVEKENQLTFSEVSDRAEWGTLYFTSSATDNVTFQTTSSGALRREFARNGALNGTIDTDFRSVQDNEPVWAFSKHFPLSAAGNGSVLFTIGFVQDPLAQFAATAAGLTPMQSLYKQTYADDGAMLAFHFSDYAAASAAGAAFAAKVEADATALVSHNYADILALSVRQAIGATAFSGTAANPVLFLKEISSDGNMQTVDVMFPAFPMFLYINPDWVAYLLEPLLENQLAGLYPNKYSMHDLGSSFPNATGHPDGADEQMPVEESGNMLYMAAAYANALIDAGRTSDAVAWINHNGSYALFRQWSDFLVTDGLVPADQLSTDDFAGSLANQTDLAVKAIVGIKAMARLAQIVGNSTDAASYAAIAAEYVPQFVDMALSRDGTHTKLAYQWWGSWGSLYNLYGDALLCFTPGTGSANATAQGAFPADLYRNQSAWYYSVRQTYGLPLDSRHLYAKSDWELWTAAVSSETVRQAIVDELASWVNNTVTNRPFTDLYDTETSDFPGINFMARPVVGGHFSVLALAGACAGQGLDHVRALFAASPDAVVDVQHSLALDLQVPLAQLPAAQKAAAAAQEARVRVKPRPATDDTPAQGGDGEL